MLGITNFNPIGAINARLQPWGFSISTKQQMISKIAFASLAMLAIHDVLSKGNMRVEAGECRNGMWCEPKQACSLWSTQPVCTTKCN
ncbi:MAG: hypothetical protein ACRCU0_05580 [Candidatus Rhabdochlamydia sp.]